MAFGRRPGRDPKAPRQNGAHPDLKRPEAAGIHFTTLYLSGAIPFSAQIGNSIANDGDALFPAIAMAPRAAVVATLYSAVPAVIVGYAWYFLFEM